MQRENPGRLAEAIQEAATRLEREAAVQRLWARDASLWPVDAAGRREIAVRLGWLDSPEWLEERAPEISEFTRGARAAEMKDVVLLGMGGSSLAPEVLATIAGIAPGHPHFAVLDSTDPEAVTSIRDAIDLRHTLFIVASKSGGTIETRSHYFFFREQVEKAGVSTVGSCFIAITDHDSPLDRLARDHSFRAIFRNPSDIGGRYSALSYFGMVPAALMGHDLAAYAEAAKAMAAPARLEKRADNPALRLAAFAGGAALSGVDKLTIVTSPRLRPLGYWIEQLVAESTGKEGRGIVPVEGEPRARASDYSGDRCFAILKLTGDNDPGLDELAGDLVRAGAPLVEIDVPHVHALAGEFLRWEVATALAGVVLEINPFDQPNVQEAKDRTAAILESQGSTTSSESSGADASAAEDALFPLGPEVEVHAAESTWSRLGKPSSARELVDAFLALGRPGEYLALLTYVSRTEERERWAAEVRRVLRDATGIPVLHGYGPRYLHSIGQLYKGGPPRGLFVVVTHDPDPDLPIPGAAWTFGQLETAQAKGDLAALAASAKPALGFHVSGDVDAGLAVIRQALSAAAPVIGSRKDTTSAPRTAAPTPEFPTPTSAR